MLRRLEGEQCNANENRLKKSFFLKLNYLWLFKVESLLVYDVNVCVFGASLVCGVQCVARHEFICGRDTN